jgi:hypothetical protein
MACQPGHVGLLIAHGDGYVRCGRDSSISFSTGTGIHPPTHCGSLLVAFPNSTHWQIPRRIWHADTHFAHRPQPLFGVKTYAFINPVVPGKGGTCLISGSHHIVGQFAQRIAMSCARYDTSLRSCDRTHGSSTSSGDPRI